MSQEVFKAPVAKRPIAQSDSECWSPSKKKKLKGFDFLSFCNVVLQYTKYESTRNEELRQNNASPLDSGGSTAESFSSESAASSYTEEENSQFDVMPRVPQTTNYSNRKTSARSTSRDGDDDEDTITCFCLKPYAGRPMIECDSCRRWIHYSCAKIRKKKIPDIYICQHCKDNKAAKRKSNRASSSPLQHSQIALSS